MNKYTIKPLRWEVKSVGLWVAEPSVGRYEIADRSLWYQGYHPELLNDQCISIEHGKQQAQAHYEALLMECLEPAE